MNNNLILAKTPQVGAQAQLNEGMSVVPSNNGSRIHRLGFIEIIEDETCEVVDTEGMAPEELEDNLHTWDSEEAADEDRLRFLTVEEAKRQGFRLCDSDYRVVADCSPQGHPIAFDEKTSWQSLRPASRPNKNNKGYSRYKN